MQGEMFWVALRSIPLFLLIALIFRRSSHILNWLRAAWLLRTLPRAEGNLVFGGVQRLMTGKRLRIMQKLNNAVVAGSGVFYYNILWGHVRRKACCSADIGSFLRMSRKLWPPGCLVPFDNCKLEDLRGPAR